MIVKKYFTTRHKRSNITINLINQTITFKVIDFLAKRFIISKIPQIPARIK